ncbi:unnamed protein product, partial [marine sediment metagenome]
DLVNDVGEPIWEGTPDTRRTSIKISVGSILSIIGIILNLYIAILIMILINAKISLYDIRNYLIIFFLLISIPFFFLADYLIIGMDFYDGLRSIKYFITNNSIIILKKTKFVSHSHRYRIIPISSINKSSLIIKKGDVAHIYFYSINAIKSKFFKEYIETNENRYYDEKIKYKSFGQKKKRIIRFYFIKNYRSLDTIIKQNFNNNAQIT